MSSLFIIGLLSKFSALFAAIINFASAWLGFLTPVLAAFIGGLSWYFKKFQVAVAIILTNLVTMALIVPLMVGAGYYSHKVTAKKCETKVITKLRTQYKFVEKKPASPKTNMDFTNPLGWWK